MTITQDRVYQREEAMQRVTNGETQADVARAYNVHPAPPLIDPLTGPSVSDAQQYTGENANARCCLFCRARQTGCNQI